MSEDVLIWIAVPYDLYDYLHKPDDAKVFRSLSSAIKWADARVEQAQKEFMERNPDSSPDEINRVSNTCLSCVYMVYDSITAIDVFCVEEVE